ncbi:MAG: hypothetical protein CM15mV19_1330 [uncultured marine virus]|nr:MAG: hypothetical protein CM15mV19_1330 [uncultured marine virus]
MTEQRVFIFLVYAFDIYFKADDITFEREDGLIKATVVGNTFIGFHHGNCKIDAPPYYFLQHIQSIVNGFLSIPKYREVHAR